MKGIQKALDLAIRKAQAHISETASRGGQLAAGLSAEGYAGGYRDALMDVDAALRGVHPNNSRFWPRPEELPKPRQKREVVASPELRAALDTLLNMDCRA